MKDELIYCSCDMEGNVVAHTDTIDFKGNKQEWKKRKQSTIPQEVVQRIYTRSEFDKLKEDGKVL